MNSVRLGHVRLTIVCARRTSRVCVRACGPPPIPSRRVPSRFFFFTTFPLNRCSLSLLFISSFGFAARKMMEIHYLLRLASMSDEIVVGWLVLF